MTEDQPQEMNKDQAQLFHTLLLHLVEGVLKQAAIASAELDISVTEASGDVLVASERLLEIIDRIMPELSDAVESALEAIPAIAITTDDSTAMLDMITGSLPPSSNNGNGEILH